MNYPVFFFLAVIVFLSALILPGIGQIIAVIIAGILIFIGAKSSEKEAEFTNNEKYFQQGNTTINYENKTISVGEYVADVSTLSRMYSTSKSTSVHAQQHGQFPSYQVTFEFNDFNNPNHKSNKFYSKNTYNEYYKRVEMALKKCGYVFK